jgi:hypothetical protein
MFSDLRNGSAPVVFVIAGRGMLIFVIEISLF